MTSVLIWLAISVSLVAPDIGTAEVIAASASAGGKRIEKDPAVRARRSVFSEGHMLLRYRQLHGYSGLKSMELSNYGCWCGYGGKGRVVDKMDACCRAHDRCWERVERMGCPGGYFIEYSYKFEGKEVICEHSKNGHKSKCKEEYCRCDRTLAQCTVRAGKINSHYLMYSGQC